MTGRQQAGAAVEQAGLLGASGGCSVNKVGYIWMCKYVSPVVVRHPTRGCLITWPMADCTSTKPTLAEANAKSECTARSDQARLVSTPLEGARGLERASARLRGQGGHYGGSWRGGHYGSSWRDGHYGGGWRLRVRGYAPGQKNRGPQQAQRRNMLT